MERRGKKRECREDSEGKEEGGVKEKRRVDKKAEEGNGGWRKSEKEEGRKVREKDGVQERSKDEWREVEGEGLKREEGRGSWGKGRWGR